jgi:hypothetical protein
LGEKTIHEVSFTCYRFNDYASLSFNHHQRLKFKFLALFFPSVLFLILFKLVVEFPNQQVPNCLQLLHVAALFGKISFNLDQNIQCLYKFVIVSSG